MSVGDSEGTTTTTTTTSTTNNNNNGHRHKANKHKRKHKHKNKRRDSAKHHRQYDEDGEEPEYPNGGGYGNPKTPPHEVYSDKEATNPFSTDEQKVLTPADLALYDASKILTGKPSKVPKIEKDDVCLRVCEVDTEVMVRRKRLGPL